MTMQEGPRRHRRSLVHRGEEMWRAGWLGGYRGIKEGVVGPIHLVFKYIENWRRHQPLH